MGNALCCKNPEDYILPPDQHEKYITEDEVHDISEKFPD